MEGKIKVSKAIKSEFAKGFRNLTISQNEESHVSLIYHPMNEVDLFPN